MAEYVLMPKLGFNMDKGQLVAWRKNEGEAFKRGEVLFVMMTDKTAMEVEATSDSVLLKILAGEGEEVPVTLPIAIVGQTQEDITALITAAYERRTPGEESGMLQPVELPEKRPGSSAETEPLAATAAAGIKISPRARKYLEDKKLEVGRTIIPGSGFQGGITQRDLEAWFAGGAEAATPKTATSFAPDDQREVLRTVPYSGMRKIIGDRLSRSQSTAPHVSFTTSVDCQDLIDFREKVNSAHTRKFSFVDFIVAASSRALQTFPQVNASLQQDRIVVYKDVNIGIAVALEAGLIVPVLRKTQTKKLAEVAAELQELTEKARSGRLSPDEYQGGTFTISNLGMFDVEQFTSIINPPEAAILSVGAMGKRPVVVSIDGEDRLTVRPLLNLTVTVDHRLIDGREAVLFLSEVKRFLENPVCLFI